MIMSCISVSVETRVLSLHLIDEMKCLEMGSFSDQKKWHNDVSQNEVNCDLE